MGIVVVEAIALMGIGAVVGAAGMILVLGFLLPPGCSTHLTSGYQPTQGGPVGSPPDQGSGGKPRVVQ